MTITAVCWRPLFQVVPVCVFVLLKCRKKEAQTKWFGRQTFDHQTGWQASLWPSSWLAPSSPSSSSPCLWPSNWLAGKPLATGHHHRRHHRHHQPSKKEQIKYLNLENEIFQFSGALLEIPPAAPPTGQKSPPTGVLEFRRRNPGPARASGNHTNKHS